MEDIAILREILSLCNGSSGLIITLYIIYRLKKIKLTFKDLEMNNHDEIKGND